MEELLELIGDGYGEDVKYDDDYMDLEEEVAKLSSPSLASEVDFNKINSLSQTILKTKSKDLKSAIYYSYSLLKLNKFSSFKDSICFVAKFVDKFWDNGFPSREKAKINGMNWWVTKIELFLDELKKVELDPKEILDCIEILESKLSAQDVNFVNIKVAINQKIIAPKPKEQKVQVQEVQEEEKDTKEEFSDLANKMGICISELLDEERKAEYFMISRMIIFNEIEDLPVVQNQKTLIPPPAIQEKNSILAMYQSQNYEGLLNLCEAKINTYLFWFDLHFYVSFALEKLGEKASSKAVRYALDILITKLEGIENMAFSDGTPFASNETKKWLNPPTTTTVVEDKYQIPNMSKKEQIEFVQNKINTSADILDKVHWWILFFENFKPQAEVKDIYVNELYQLLDEYKIDKIDINLAKQAYMNLFINIDDNSELKNNIMSKIAILDAGYFL